MSGEIVPRTVLVKQGLKSVGGVAGGIGLLVLGLSGWLPSLIIGGVVTLIGLGISSSKKDRVAGLITTGAGILAMVSIIPILGGLSNPILFIGGIGLIVAGGLSLFKFIKNLLKRT